jgi:hypothetical protein
MNALIIADLSHSQALDREALARIGGAGRAKYCVTGTHFANVEVVMQKSASAFSLISEATNAMIKTLGEALAQAARKE